MLISTQLIVLYTCGFCLKCKQIKKRDRNQGNKVTRIHKRKWCSWIRTVFGCGSCRLNFLFRVLWKVPVQECFLFNPIFSYLLSSSRHVLAELKDINNKVSIKCKHLYEVTWITVYYSKVVVSTVLSKRGKVWKSHTSDENKWIISLFL